jgi:hypothetical protein
MLINSPIFEVVSRLVTDGDPQGLRQELEAVRTAAYKIWTEQRLKWYTDHKAQTHSERIIAHLWKLIKGLQDTPQKLNANELTILLSACYLHDIGMQDFNVNGKPIDELDLADYDKIRSQHALRGRELILQRGIKWEKNQFTIPLDDDNRRLCVALLTHAHSSSSFDQVLKEIEEYRIQPGGEPCRLDLLAALLLIADELDLHSDRARFLAEATVSPSGELHNCSHSYITEVDLTSSESGLKRVRLSFIFPHPMARVYAPRLERWLVAKLCRQIRRVGPIISARTGGEINIDDCVEVNRSFVADSGRPILSEPAQRLLDREIERQREVDRGAVLGHIRALAGRQVLPYPVLEIHSNGDDDWPSLHKRFSAELAVSAVPLVVLSFAEVVSGHDPSSIVERALVDVDAVGTGAATVTSVDLGLARLCDHLAKVQGVVLIEYPERTDDEVIRRWLSNEFLGTVVGNGTPVIIVTAQPGWVAAEAQAASLTPFDIHDIAQHYRLIRGFTEAEARRKAEVAHVYNQGEPAGIIRSLDVEARQEIYA